MNFLSAASEKSKKKYFLGISPENRIRNLKEETI